MTLQPAVLHQFFGPAQLRATALCAVAGVLAAWAHLPIPWMLGPLTVMALAKWRGLEVVAPQGFRSGGQWVIGTALGLYFTPAMILLIVKFLPLMVLAGLFAIFIGYAGGRVLARMAGNTAANQASNEASSEAGNQAGNVQEKGGIAVDPVTAFYSCVPGGATEMVNLAERHGGRPDLVAVAQSVRLLLIIGLIPALFTYSGVHGADAYEPGVKFFDATGMLQLLGCTIAGGWLLGRVGAPNAYMLGPLLVAMGLTGSGVEWSALPQWLINAGQVMMGCSLGSRFEADFFKSAPRFMWAAAVGTLAAILLAAGFGFALAWVANIHLATALLALAPGGIAEMSITAKVLKLGVPVVTAFHVTRVVILVTLTGPVFRFFTRRKA